MAGIMEWLGGRVESGFHCLCNFSQAVPWIFVKLSPMVKRMIREDFVGEADAKIHPLEVKLKPQENGSFELKRHHGYDCYVSFEFGKNAPIFPS